MKVNDLQGKSHKLAEVVSVPPKHIEIEMLHPNPSMFSAETVVMCRKNSLDWMARTVMQIRAHEKVA
jgi:hypothetical protein